MPEPHGHRATHDKPPHRPVLEVAPPRLVPAFRIPPCSRLVPCAAAMQTARWRLTLPVVLPPNAWVFRGHNERSRADWFSETRAATRLPRKECPMTTD